MQFPSWSIIVNGSLLIDIYTLFLIAYIYFDQSDKGRASGSLLIAFLLATWYSGVMCNAWCIILRIVPNAFELWASRSDQLMCCLFVVCHVGEFSNKVD